jgi:toxin ParE1/3/4
MPQVLRTPQAEQDLLEVWDYIAADNPVAADRLLDRIGHLCDRLAEFPEMGRERSELAPALRSFPVGNYVLFYRPADDGIQLIRVLHGARDVDRVFPP